MKSRAWGSYSETGACLESEAFHSEVNSDIECLVVLVMNTFQNGALFAEELDEEVLKAKFQMPQNPVFSLKCNIFLFPQS